MLQIRLTLRVDSTSDSKSSVDWFVIKQGDIYAVTCLVLLTPVWAAFWAQVAKDALYAKGN